MKLVNVMKHEANLLFPNGEVLTLIPSGDVTTCTETTTVGKPFAGFPTIKRQLGELVGLPEPQEGVVYYCNMLSFEAAIAIGRTDVVMGDSGSSAVRWTAEENPKLAGLVRYVTHLILP